MVSRKSSKFLATARSLVVCLIALTGLAAGGAIVVGSAGQYISSSPGQGLRL